MKKLALFFICALISGVVVSQEIVLTFNPVGAASTIDSIKATNVETGKSITISGNESLQLSAIATAISTINIGQGNSRIYPNPFDSRTTLEYYSQNEGDITVLLINALGQIVATNHQRIASGTHKFDISGKSAGMYYATIISNSGRESHKMVCTGRDSNEDKIQYVGLSGETIKNKSGLVERGELFHFEFTSGDYRTIIADRPTESKTYDVEFMECKDNYGKDYKVVQIGEQWWLAENLAYLPSVSPSSEKSETAPYYYVYDYQGSNVSEAKATANYSTYGVLYNWTAAMNGATSSATNPSGVQGVCPAGWHLPSLDEWTQLTDYLGGRSIAGSKLKETGTTHWLSPNTGATNEIGFTALPGGYKADSGYSINIGKYGFWWTATEFTTSSGWALRLNYNDFVVGGESTPFDYGKSVRCVRD